MRNTLRSALASAEELRPRPEFAAELAAKLRPQAAAVSRRSLLQSWWALAAGAALAIGGGVWVRESRSRLASLAREAAGDHQNCAIRFNLAERPIPLEEAARRYGAPYGALATFQLPRLELAAEPLDRHSCVYQGRRFGHIVFRYGGAVASLLVTDGEAPSTAELLTDDGGSAVAAMPAGRFVAFVVADLDRPRVLRLAQTIAKPLSRHLA
jgi:hypothetical protein